MSDSVDVLVVGGGAAGIIAAARAAQSGARVVLLEKNGRLGMKILISGGGKCNLTHAGPMEEVRRQFRAGEARFLKPPFYRFTNDDFLDILHARGMRTYVRPDGRVFPVEPSNAKDVVGLLAQYIVDAGVRIRTECPVTALCVSTSPVRVTGVETAGRFIAADRVIVSTGGSSYPATGATGDGWRWLRELGHTIVPLRAALAPLYLADAVTDWSGVALRDVTLKARATETGRELSRWTGDLLFTHKGVSGPTALGVSREVAEHMELSQAAEIAVDLAPRLDFEAVQQSLRDIVRENAKKTASALPAAYVPARLTAPLLAAAGIDPALRLAVLPARSLNRLVEVVKGWPLGRVRHVPLERGEVVAGGVALDEVDPHTMQSRLVAGLYLCGEILDVAGPVGGYNLQAAWSTGCVAGESAAAALDDGS